MFQYLRILLLKFFFLFLNFTEHPGNPPTHEQSPAIFRVLFRCHRHNNRCFLWGEKNMARRERQKANCWDILGTTSLKWIIPICLLLPWAPWQRKWFVWTEAERYILVANLSRAHPWQIQLVVSYLSSHSAVNTKMQGLNVDLIPAFVLLIIYV